MPREYVDINVLQGKIITEIEIGDDYDEILFTCIDGSQYKMYHEQDCCERVTIEDINGDIKDLLNYPVLLAEESSNSGQEEPYGDSFTWTYYKIVTVKGYVNIRWYGSSNGYYSESVQFIQITPDRNAL